MQKFTRSRAGSLLATGAMLSPLTLAVPIAQAQQTTPPVTAPVEGPIISSLELRDARLEQAVGVLTSRTGLRNIVIQASAGKAFGPVNVKLADQPLSKAIQAIADSAGAILVQKDGIYYLRPRTEQDDAPVVTAPAPQVVATPVVPAAPVRRPRMLTKIYLSFLQPSVFKGLLTDPDFLNAEMDRFTNRAQFPRSEIISTPMLRTGGDDSRPATPASPQGGVAGSSAGRVGESPDAAGARGGQGFPGRGGGGGQGFGGGGQGFGGGGQGFGGQGGPGGAGGQQGGASLRPPGITNLISNDADNALLVEYDDVDDLNRLRELVRLLDVKPKQVQVRAEFVRVSVTDADSFGIDWRINPIGNLDTLIPAESGGSGSPTILLAYATGNAVANLRAALIRETGNVLQAPIISTINNQRAFVNISDVITVPQSTVVQNAATTATSTTFAQYQTTNGLSVLPHINGDNSVTLSIQPQLQTLDPLSNGGFRSNIQTLATTRVVQSGETMVVGGFISKQEVRSERRVPVLGDLPVIGRLFQQNSRTVNGFEVLVFLTPTIIEDRSQGATGTAGAAPAPTP